MKPNKLKLPHGWMLTGTALGMLLCPIAAHAQMQAAPDATLVADETGAGGLDEIVVTAEKRETNLQKTPISISVLGEQALANRHVQSLLDLQDGAVPSLRIGPNFTRNSALSVGIRGITGGDSNQPSRDAGIGVYIDGVYLGRAQGLGMALMDIERIEVLKGPQGTLFGRNSVGGAVSIVSKKPSGEFGLRQTLGLRNYNGYSSETHLDLPSFANIALKFDAVFLKRDGVVENRLEGADDFNRFDRRGVHGAALWEPSADFSAQIDADYSYDVTTPYYVQLLNLSPTAYPLAPLVKVQPDRAKTADIGVPQRENVGETYGVSLHLKWKVSDAAELRSISAYRHLEQDQWDNGIGAHAGTVFQPNAAFARYSLASMRQEQYSQEFQLVGDAGRLQYVAGHGVAAGAGAARRARGDVLPGAHGRGRRRFHIRNQRPVRRRLSPGSQGRRALQPVAAGGAAGAALHRRGRLARGRADAAFRRCCLHLTGPAHIGGGSTASSYSIWTTRSIWSATMS